MTNPIQLPTGAAVAVAPPAVPPLEAAPPLDPTILLVPVPGAPGPAGPAGDNAPMFNETPGGALNGVNLTFTTLYPFVPGTTAVYLNGLREFPGDGYTEAAPNSIVFDDAPLSTDKLRVDYIIQ